MRGVIIILVIIAMAFACNARVICEPGKACECWPNDEPEECDGSSPFCPDIRYKPKQIGEDVICRDKSKPCPSSCDTEKHTPAAHKTEHIAEQDRAIYDKIVRDIERHIEQKGNQPKPKLCEDIDRNCPADTFEPVGTTCNPARDVCDRTETPLNKVAVCNAALAPCDAPPMCNGDDCTEYVQEVDVEARKAEEERRARKQWFDDHFAGIFVLLVVAAVAWSMVTMYLSTRPALKWRFITVYPEFITLFVGTALCATFVAPSLAAFFTSIIFICMPMRNPPTLTEAEQRAINGQSTTPSEPTYLSVFALRACKMRIFTPYIELDFFICALIVTTTCNLPSLHTTLYILALGLALYRPVENLPATNEQAPAPPLDATPTRGRHQRRHTISRIDFSAEEKAIKAEAKKRKLQ